MPKSQIIPVIMIFIEFLTKEFFCLKWLWKNVKSWYLTLIAKKKKEKKKEMLRVFKFLTYAKKFMILIIVSLKW